MVMIVVSMLMFFVFFKVLVALKKGTQLLKYGRKGKPKFYPFRLSNVSILPALLFSKQISKNYITLLDTFVLS